MTKNLTAGSPVKLIILFTLPLLIGNLFQQLYAVADTLVVGRMLGVDALAAVGASGSLQFLLFGFAMGASTGMGIPVARAFGSGDLRATRRAVAAGAIISATIATAITLIGIFGSGALLTLLGTPAELMDDAQTFLGVLFAGAVATVAFNFLSSMIRALGVLKKAAALANAQLGQLPADRAELIARAADDVIAWARERIAAFKAPKSVDVIPLMPRNASGKILRRELRAP